MARMRRSVCADCKKPFRTFEPDRRVCQNCDGSAPTNAEAVTKEGEAIRKANAAVKKAPQSVDPRTGLPTEPGKPGPVTASKPATKKKA